MSSSNTSISPSYLANTTSVKMSEPASSNPDIDAIEPLRVQTQLKSRYTVFDASGRLPFDLVFGLRRRYDSDPRDISFQTTRSFLDVPYALANGLLKLHELRCTDTSPNEHFEVDLSRLRAAIADDEPELEYIILASKANRKAKRGQLGVTEYRYRVNAGSPLASIFETNKKYSIGIANRDLGIHCWVDSGHSPSSGADCAPASTTESTTNTCKLVTNPHSSSFATFTVIESLVWPPSVETRLHLLNSPTDDNSDSDNLNLTLLRVTVTNTGSDAISIQTRRLQHFLGPHSPFQPESEDGLNPGRLPCILDPASTTSSLQVVDVATGSVVRNSRPSRSPCGRAIGDQRPKVTDLMVLEPGVPLNKDIEIDALVRKLYNGRYFIRLKPKGCWWQSGEIESEPGDDGRVPKCYRTGRHTPVVLQSDDEVLFDMRDGKIVRAES
jgi:hypothetical protein